MASAGFHAISIVGWGVSENVNVEFYGKKYVYPKIEYWVCRNSWTEKWGTYNGYFKYAFYHNYKDQGLPEINLGVAFETNNTAYGASIGGILMVEPDSIVDPMIGSKILNKIDCTKYTCEPPRYITIDDKKKEMKEIKHQNIFIQILLYVCLALITIICLKNIFNPNSKRKHK